MAVPNIFGSATAAIPLSQLDQNFATAITLGNTAVYLGNTTTSLGNVTLTNVTISSGNVSVSTATVGAGSNTAPSITTTGDTNTGIFFPAADQVAITTGGTQRAVVDASGNVGVGTSSPNEKLQVNGAVLSTGALSAVRTSAASVDFLTGNTRFISMGADASTKGGFIWYNSTNAAVTEAMRIDSSGNVGIGTSSPSKLLQVTNADRTVSSTQVLLEGSYNAYGTGISFQSRTSSGGTLVEMARIVADGEDNWNTTASTQDAGLRFYTTLNGTSAEKMRIDSNGNLLVGTPSVPTNGASGSGAATFSDSINVKGITSHAGISGAYQTNRMNLQWNGSATRLWVDSTDTGSITVSSDYRVKKDIETQTQNALSRIALIRPVTYTYADYEPFSWKADGVSREGFIAHELQVVVPSAVDGEKDAENQIQSLKLDALCAVMVKAIQEQQALITQLQADVAALKGTA